jgi:hypothetical protein
VPTGIRRGKARGKRRRRTNVSSACACVCSASSRSCSSRADPGRVAQADERKAAIANVNDDALRLIRIVTSNQAAQVEAARQLLTAFARLPQIQTKDAAACNAFLAEMLKAYPLYLNIAVADRNGNLVCSALPFRSPINVADRAYFKMALQTHDFVIGDYQIGVSRSVPRSTTRIRWWTRRDRSRA